ncbi:MarR family winged helix-turn-helix transcriptional regulator [Microbacterium sp. GXF7504]
MTADGTARDEIDRIAAALSRLRGPRRPGRGEHDHAHHGPGAHGGPRPWGGGFPPGPPPWAGGPHARMGGPARFRMLDALAAASEPLSVSELGEAIGVDQPRASRLVQQGVDLGLVRREADPADARRTRIALTDQGREAVRGFRGERRETVSTALEGFTDAERAELARLLTKLAEAWPR